ncbi:MAG: DEAD/DEAH box helicase [Thermoplasmata archaeon]
MLASKLTRIQDICPECGKIAKERFSFESKTNDGNTVKVITLECWHIVKKVIPKGTAFHEFITYEHRNNGCNHVWNKNRCDDCGAFRLYEFQVEGARFIESCLSVNNGVGLFDDMGLGKTVQDLAYIYFHPEKLPVLFVVKSAVKYQFFKEIIRWLGPNYLPQIIQTSKDPVLPGLKTYITTYDLLRRFDIAKFDPIGIKLVIFDECQQIKNPDAARTQMARRVAKGKQVIVQSGTPWKNRGSELFTALNMLDPRRFYSYNSFFYQWVDTYYQGQYLKIGGIRHPEKFREYTKDIIIRRERKEVMQELPQVTRNILHYNMAEVEEKAYSEATEEFIQWYQNYAVSGETNTLEFHSNLLARLARLRHITGLAKIPATLAFAEEFVEDTDRKLAIFVHHKDVGESLFDELKAKASEWNNGIKVLKLTAAHSPQERFQIQEEFNTTPRAILVASTLASGEGINLQTCSDCVMHERQWNPANEEQAEARFIRIGQTADVVTATYVIADDTIDEYMTNLVERKRVDFHKAMNTGELPKWNESELAKELADIILKNFRKKGK